MIKFNIFNVLNFLWNNFISRKIASLHTLMGGRFEIPFDQVTKITLLRGKSRMSKANYYSNMSVTKTGSSVSLHSNLAIALIF